MPTEHWETGAAAILLSFPWTGYKQLSMSSPLHGWLKTTCLVERGQSPGAKNHFQRMSCSFWCIICQPNFLVYFPISFGTHHTPNPAQPVEHWIAVPRTFHSITDTFRCGAYHSLLSSACSPSRSWHPYHTQLSLSHWGFLFRIAGYGRGKKKKEGEKILCLMKTLSLYLKALIIYPWKPKEKD